METSFQDSEYQRRADRELARQKMQTLATQRAAQLQHLQPLQEAQQDEPHEVTGFSD